MVNQHLSFDELVIFNSMTLAELRSSSLASRVTVHIRECRECRDELRLIQAASDIVSLTAKRRGIAANGARANDAY